MYSRRQMQFHTKLKTTSTGNNTFLFVPHRKQKIRYAKVFRYPVPVPVSAGEFVWYPVLCSSGRILKTAIRYIPNKNTKSKTVTLYLWYYFTPRFTVMIRLLDFIQIKINTILHTVCIKALGDFCSSKYSCLCVRNVIAIFHHSLFRNICVWHILKD